MSSRNLEAYLQKAFDEGVLDHTFRIGKTADGMRLCIQPAEQTGEPLDFKIPGTLPTPPCRYRENS